MITSTTTENQSLILETLLSMLEPVGWMLLHSLWQLTLIGILFFVVRFIARACNSRNNARIIYTVGCICLFTMLLLPASTFFYCWNCQPETGNPQGIWKLEQADATPVSYTHLTLPTILLV